MVGSFRGDSSELTGEVISAAIEVHRVLGVVFWSICMRMLWLLSFKGEGSLLRGRKSFL